MDRVVVTIDVQNVGPRRVNVRKNLYVQGLIDEVRNKFDLLQGDYVLSLKGASEPLDPSRTLEQHGITEGAELLFFEAGEETSDVKARIEAGIREPISEDNRVYLQEERQGLVFEIEWQPAIIGRSDQRNPSMNRLLTVNLGGLRGAEYVSRHHACIIEEHDQYFIESLNPRNPTYVNNKKLEYGSQYILQPGDRIGVGKVTLIFNQRG